jgi:hypothetical protein
MNRRDFLRMTLAGTAGIATTSTSLWPAWAQTAAPADNTATVLKAVKRSLDINGKAASVFGLTQNSGAHGVTMNAGASFDVALGNELTEPTLIHWHGMTPPWPMDGVPDMPAPLLKPGEIRRYTFPVTESGTYWMHAHTLQEQNLLAAPLIVRDAADAGKDEQEVVVLLHDFSFTPADELLARLKAAGGPRGMMMGGMNHDASMSHMAQMGGMGAMKPGRAMPGMGNMDLNDIAYDAYLANDRTLGDPEVIRVERSGRAAAHHQCGCGDGLHPRYRQAGRGVDRRRWSGRGACSRLFVPDRDGSAPRYSAGSAQGRRRLPNPGTARRSARAGRNRTGHRIGAHSQNADTRQPQRPGDRT